MGAAAGGRRQAAAAVAAAATAAAAGRRQAAAAGSRQQQRQRAGGRQQAAGEARRSREPTTLQCEACSVYEEKKSVSPGAVGYVARIKPGRKARVLAQVRSQGAGDGTSQIARRGCWYKSDRKARVLAQVRSQGASVGTSQVHTISHGLKSSATPMDTGLHIGPIEMRRLRNCSTQHPRRWCVQKFRSLCIPHAKTMKPMTVSEPSLTRAGY